MKQCSQTHKETAIQSLLFPKTVTRIGKQNVRTLQYMGLTGNAQVARKMDKNGVEVLVLSEYSPDS